MLKEHTKERAHGNFDRTVLYQACTDFFLNYIICLFRVLTLCSYKTHCILFDRNRYIKKNIMRQVRLASEPGRSRNFQRPKCTLLKYKIQNILTYFIRLEYDLSTDTRIIEFWSVIDEILMPTHHYPLHRGITTYRNGPERTYENTETDFYGYRNGPERTSVGTETDRNRLQHTPKRTSIGTSKGRVGYDWNNPNKSMYILVGRYVGRLYVCMYVCVCVRACVRA